MAMTLECEKDSPSLSTNLIFLQPFHSDEEEYPSHKTNMITASFSNSTPSPADETKDETLLPLPQHSPFLKLLPELQHLILSYLQNDLTTLTKLCRVSKDIKDRVHQVNVLCNITILDLKAYKIELIEIEYHNLYTITSAKTKTLDKVTFAQLKTHVHDYANKLFNIIYEKRNNDLDEEKKKYPEVNENTQKTYKVKASLPSNDPVYYSLSFSNFYLRAVPPALISSFEECGHLMMQKNLIRRLPNNFGNLKSLTILNLSQNLLEILPESFTSLQQLQELYLQENLFKKFPKPIFSLNALSILDLSRNKLISIPKEIGALKSLGWLELEDMPTLVDFPTDSFNTNQCLSVLLEGSGLKEEDLMGKKPADGSITYYFHSPKMSGYTDYYSPSY